MTQKFLESVRAWRYSLLISWGRFRSPEPEFCRLSQWIREGDWVLDIGANVGQYTNELSRIVGRTGRVFAFEPVPETFRMLTRNAVNFPQNNVTLLNVAVGERFGEVRMVTPKGRWGVPNHYLAQVTSKDGEFAVVTVPVDSFQFDHRISLVKLDVEGFEREALAGMANLLQRDNPVLIVEASPGAVNYLNEKGIRLQQSADSPNIVVVQAPGGSESGVFGAIPKE